jgi:hypothetical protein
LTKIEKEGGIMVFKILRWRKQKVSIVNRLEELFEEFRMRECKDTQGIFYLLLHNEPFQLFCEYLFQRFKKDKKEKIDFNGFLREVLVTADELARGRDFSERTITHPLSGNKIDIWVALQHFRTLNLEIFRDLNTQEWKKFEIFTKKEFLDKGIVPPWEEDWSTRFICVGCRLGEISIFLEKSLGIALSPIEYEAIKERIDNFFNYLSLRGRPLKRFLKHP